MGKPAARISDMHVCPMVTPGVPPVPHVGGPVTGPGNPTVLIAGVPAATMGDMCTCVGPPDTIILGSTGVLIGGKPAARMGDSTTHGGSIVIGCPTVLIGETRSGTVSPPAVSTIMQAMKNVAPEVQKTMSQLLERVTAAETGAAFIQGPGVCSNCSKEH